MPTSLASLGEEAAVARVLDLLGRHWPCDSLEPGDDVGCVPRLPAVLKIDGYSVASMRLPWMNMEDVGWKAVAAAMSDVVAKAAQPVAVAVSVGLSGDESVEELEALVKGSVEAAREHGAWLIGGDTNSSPSATCEWIDVAVVGVSRNPIPLNPRPGDAVYTTIGRYGLSGAAIHAALNRLAPPATAVQESRRPRLRLAFIELAGRLRDCITGSRDVSDGLAYTLLLLARKASSTLVLERLPTVPLEVERYAEANGVSLEDLVLNGGEEYEVVFTVKPGCTDLVEEAAASLGLQVERIGRLTRSEKPAVTYTGRPVRVMRWDQFRGYVAVANG